MKKIIKVLLAISIMLMTVMSVYSQKPYEVYQINFDTIDIVIEHHGLSQHKLDMIVNSELGIENTPVITPYNILCLFGHNISSGNYSSTSHSPCVKHTYTYETCTRDNCGYYSNTLIDTQYLYCH